MDDIDANTCSSSVPGILRYAFRDHSQAERKEIIAKAMYELGGQLAFMVDPPRDPSRPEPEQSLDLERDEIPDKVELRFKGGCTRYEGLKIHVLSEPNQDRHTKKEKPCIVRADIHRYAMPEWLRPWDLTIGA
jgi:hypothetical protein